MKASISLGFMLLLAAPLHAETYSWVDDSGTYNYTEDFSRVPKKFQKKAKRREDPSQGVKPPASEVSNGTAGKTETNGVRSAAVPEGAKELYGGKSHAAWRKELDVLEAELSGIEQHMELLRKQIYDPKGVSKVQFEGLKKEYDDTRETYGEKYKKYSDLIEAVRKAGIIVEIKK